MVKERRLIFEAEDILSLRIICVNCNGEVVYPLIDTFNPVTRCPHCNSLLRDPASQDVIDYLRLWLQQARTAETRYRVRMEMHEPLTFVA